MKLIPDMMSLKDQINYTINIKPGTSANYVYEQNILV